MHTAPMTTTPIKPPNQRFGPSPPTRDIAQFYQANKRVAPAAKMRGSPHPRLRPEAIRGARRHVKPCYATLGQSKDTTRRHLRHRADKLPLQSLQPAAACAALAERGPMQSMRGQKGRACPY